MKSTIKDKNNNSDDLSNLISSEQQICSNKYQDFISSKETIMTSSFDEGNGTDEACSPTASSGTTSCGYSDNDSLLPSHSQSSFSVKNCRSDTPDSWYELQMKFSSFHPPTSSNLPSAELQSSNFSQLPPAYLSQPLPEKCRSTSVETDKPVPNIMNSSSSKAVEDKGNVKNTYRLNLLPPPQKQLRSQLVCNWEECGEVFKSPVKLQAHLHHVHVNAMTENSNFSCKWVGCRVFGKSSRNSNCLLQHVTKVHSKCKPHACCFPGCNSRFNTANQLERHVTLHLDQTNSSAPITDNSAKKQHHKRERRLPLPNRDDCMDEYVMNKISTRLLQIKKVKQNNGNYDHLVSFNRLLPHRQKRKNKRDQKIKRS